MLPEQSVSPRLSCNVPLLQPQSGSSPECGAALRLPWWVGPAVRGWGQQLSSAGMQCLAGAADGMLLCAGVASPASTDPGLELLSAR